MLKLKRHIAIMAILGSMILSGNATAHTTVVTKNTPDEYNTRNELEGSSSVNYFSISHGCDGQPVRAQSIVFPNDTDVIAVRRDTNEPVNLADHIEGNAVMGAMPAVNSLFKRIKKLAGPVPPFISHGEVMTEDTRAFVYTEGRLKDGFLGLIPWRATFPKFKSNSCATALIVNIAIANYCTKSQNEDADNRADIWMGRLTQKFDDPDVVSVGFWPYVKIVRDLKNNPIEASCGEGFEIIVSPSEESIDKFLPVKGYWPSE